MAKVPYRQAVGFIRYLVTCTRPDLTFSASQVSQFLQDPGQTHWQAVKRIFCYLVGTPDLGITYKRAPSSALISWCDSDWASDLDTRKSTTGFIT